MIVSLTLPLPECPSVPVQVTPDLRIPRCMEMLTPEDVIRRIDLKSGVITTVVGTGKPGDGPDRDPSQCKLKRPHGVFATRSPRRPNPIGLTVVELLSREGPLLHVRGVDMLDGTPILDIKPYLTSVPPGRLRRGWLAEAEARGSN